VATVIERLTGVHYHAGHVWYILRGLRWSLQRPARQARERDEPAIRQWIASRWPAVKKRPAPARLARLRRRKRVSQQPVVRRTGRARPDPGPDPHGRPLATALGGWGAGLPLGWAPDPLLFPDVSRHLYGGDLIRFLRHLKRHFRGHRVILIWDGLGAHQSRAMRAYLARQRHWLHVERLPGYAPELNPIEQVWGNVKAREMANVCAPELTALRRPLHTGLAACVANPTSLSPSCGIPDSSSNMTVTLFNETH